MSTASRLSDELLAGAALMERRSESIRAVMNSEQNRFSRALQALERLSQEAGAPLAIVGGLGAIRYGHPAVTEDIDIVAASGDLDRLLEHAPQCGFRVIWRSEKGWHSLEFEDVEINVVPEGGRARDSSPTTIPGPLKLGVAAGLDYASLPGWVELKLSAGRAKDRTHVIEVLKTLDSSRVEEIAAHLQTVDAGYLLLFRQLVDEAAEERQQESERGRR